MHRGLPTARMPRPERRIRPGAITLMRFELPLERQAHFASKLHLPHMNSTKPKTRTEANKPEETKHLSPGQKRALDVQSEAERTDGKDREKLTHKMTREK